MTDKSPFLILHKPCEEAIDWVTSQIRDAGLRFIRTFDLQEARRTPRRFRLNCPYHGIDPCDCQMVVLLVYGGDRPVSIVAHGRNQQTCFSVVDSPQQRADPQVETAIRLALVPLA